MLTEREKRDYRAAVLFNQAMQKYAPSVLAGGCARDILRGKAPKDYDLWLLSDTHTGEVLEYIAGIYNDLTLRGYESHAVINRVFDGNYEGAPERDDIEFVIKMEFLGVSLDIIKIKRAHNEAVGVLDVFDTFDFPINKFALTLDGNVVGSGHGYPDQYAERSLGEGRLEHMRSKFPNHNFYDLQ